MAGCRRIAISPWSYARRTGLNPGHDARTRSALSSGLDGRPFMMLGTAAGHHSGSLDESWDEGRQWLDGWKRRLTGGPTPHNPEVTFQRP